MLQIKSALDSERLNRVEHDLREIGFHIIENVITPEEADEARRRDMGPRRRRSRKQPGPHLRRWQNSARVGYRR